MADRKMTPPAAHVSIVITTYNDAAYVSDAIESALTQTYPHCEIIVVDDGSTDETRALLTARYGEQVRYIYQENRGPGAARNRGVAAADGAFIQLCDADDRLHPEKVEKSLALMQAHSGTGVIYSAWQSVAADGVTPLDGKDEVLQPEGDIFCTMLHQFGARILLAASFIARDAWLLFDERPEIQGAEDWHFFLKLAASGVRFRYLDERLAYYRQITGSLSRQQMRVTRGRLHTVIAVRDWEARRRCMDDAAYVAFLAGRWHVWAMALWRANRRSEARAAFAQASRLTASGRLMRLLYRLMTYGLPVQSAEWLNRRLRR